MTGERRKRRTHIVPRLVFQTAITGVVPAVAVACGGSVTGDTTNENGGSGGVAGTSMTGGRGGSDIIVLAVAGFGPTGGYGYGGAIALAIGGYGASYPTGGRYNTGGYGYGGVIVLAIGGYGASYPTGGVAGVPVVDAGPSDAAAEDASPPQDGNASVDGGSSDASSKGGAGGGPIVLAMSGFGVSEPSKTPRRL